MMNSNPASLPFSWARPAGYVSLRQELAKRHGTVHFQPLGISMAPAPSTPSPRSSPSSSYSSTASYDYEEQQRRGRSSAVRPLWAYSPSDDVHAALAMEDRRWSADTIKPPTTQEAPESSAATSTASQPASPLADATFEPPTGSTSSLPILSRPPPLPSATTPLELQAEYAEAADGDESEETSYLAPPQWATTTKKAAERAQRTQPGTKVLYTRAQLPQLDEASRNFWHAMHHFRALANKPRSLPADHPPVLSSADAAAAAACPFSREGGTEDSALVSSTFNWSSLWLPEHVEGTWYGVVFRSLRKAGSESLNLYEADRLSHEEAVGSGGLLVYFYGEPDGVTGENLATCVWTSREDAVKASRLPRHKEAVGHAMKAYSYFRLTRYRVVKRRGEHHVRVEEWDEEE